MTLTLTTNQTLKQVEEVLIEEEVLDVVDVVVVGEEQSSKMTADLSLNLKVGRMLSHLPHSLLIPNPELCFFISGLWFVTFTSTFCKQCQFQKLF